MPETNQIEALLECAVAAVEAAGTHAMENLHRRREMLKVALHDVKLKLDVECQERIVEVIRSCFPEHAILGEEALDEHPLGTEGEGLQWVVDPIDGTVNFSHGYPLWCSSVAVRRGEEMLAGAVYAPMLDKLFTATVDGPATCNSDAIHVSEVDTMAEAIVFTGTNQVIPPGWRKWELFERIAARAQRPRIDGVAALDLCHVACGLGDGYIESGIYIWDTAAAGLIVRRAGGMAEKLRDLEGGAMIFAASNGSIQEELRGLVENQADV